MRTNRTHQGLLVHANRAGIECRVAVLGLRKQHDLAAAACRVHGGFDKGVSADSEDDGIRAPAICLRQDAFDDIFAAGMNGIIEAKFCGDGVALGIQIRGQHSRTRPLAQARHASGRWAPGR